MVKTDAPSTLCRPFDACSPQALPAASCVHTEMLQDHLAARRTLCCLPDAPVAPPACAAPKAMSKRRVLRPVYQAAPPSPAELRQCAEERAYRRLLRPWMTKLQRKDLQLLVHALPASHRERFSELAIFAMQQVLPRASAWALFDALWAAEPDEMLGVLELCHTTALCQLPLHKQLGVIQKLGAVPALWRAQMLACACTLLGSARLVAAYPDLLRSLAMMPPEHWSAFVQLCMPVLEHFLGPRSLAH